MNSTTTSPGVPATDVGTGLRAGPVSMQSIFPATLP